MTPPIPPPPESGVAHGVGTPQSGEPGGPVYPPSPPFERPPVLSPQQAALSATDAARAAAEAAQRASEQLVDFAERQQTPARIIPITFDGTGTSPRISTTDVLHGPDPPSRSIGVLNPAGAPLNVQNVGILIGVAGATARLANRVPIVPAGALLVLPIQASDLELAVDATALGANTATFWLLRFESVQRAFFGRGT